MVGENLINENLINPSELDLLQYTNKTIDLPLFLEVRGQFLDCGEFVKLSFTCSGEAIFLFYPELLVNIFHFSLLPT